MRVIPEKSNVNGYDICVDLEVAYVFVGRPEGLLQIFTNKWDKEIPDTTSNESIAQVYDEAVAWAEAN